MEININKAQKLKKENAKGRSSEQDDESTNESSRDSNLIKSVASLLCDIVSENTNSQDSDTKKKSKKGGIFSAKKPPSVSVLTYLERILKYTKLEDPTLVVTLIYLDRICDMNDYQMDNFNIHR